MEGGLRFSSVLEVTMSLRSPQSTTRQGVVTGKCVSVGLSWSGARCTISRCGSSRVESRLLPP